MPGRSKSTRVKVEPNETAAPRRSPRLHDQGQAAPSKAPKRAPPKTKNKKPAKRSTRKRRTRRDLDETESDSDVEVRVTCKREPGTAATVQDGVVLQKMVGLVERMETHLHENEAARARERADVSAAHRTEQQEMRQFFTDVIATNARQMQLATAVFREAMEAKTRQA